MINELDRVVLTESVHTAAVVTVEASQIPPVSRRDITHAREFAAR